LRSPRHAVSSGGAVEAGRLGAVPKARARLEESYTLRRLKRRVGRRPSVQRAQPPERPVGIKLELTHACNLRCDFCYTDSPRHTVARSADLSDQAWRKVVEQALELGVVEAVLTGGEPLLRTPLVLELLERLIGGGVGVTLNTNGWFLDEALADRLAQVRGLTVNVSLDGATAELHDAARGVPGSWRRAVRAIALLLERDVNVIVVHVVTPLNAPWVGELLEHLWLLGVRVIRLTPVLPIGAASRVRGWTVDRRALRRTVSEARLRFGETFQPIVQSGVPEIMAARESRAPAALLVRPSGAVLIDSLHPFAFGHVDDGLAACWQQIVAEWRAPEIEAWARSIPSSRRMADASVVPYADPEPMVGSMEAARLTGPDRIRAAPGTVAPRLPRRTGRSTEPSASAGDLEAAREQVLELSLARRYSVVPLRWTGDRDGERVLRLLDDGRMCRLNASAGLVLEQLGDRTVSEAVAALAARHPDIPGEQLTLDTLRTARWLAARGVLRRPTPRVPV